MVMNCSHAGLHVLSDDVREGGQQACSGKNCFCRHIGRRCYGGELARLILKVCLRERSSDGWKSESGRVVYAKPVRLCQEESPVAGTTPPTLGDISKPEPHLLDTVIFLWTSFETLSVVI